MQLYSRGVKHELVKDFQRGKNYSSIKFSGHKFHLLCHERRWNSIKHIGSSWLSTCQLPRYWLAEFWIINHPPFAGSINRARKWIAAFVWTVEIYEVLQHTKIQILIKTKNITELCKWQIFVLIHDTRQICFNGGNTRCSRCFPSR